MSLRLLYLIIRQVLGLALLIVPTSTTKDVELLALRHEVAAPRRTNPRPRIDWADRTCGCQKPHALSLTWRFAARTSQIRLRNAVTVLSAANPVRVFQEFATVDLISGGRVELVVGRGSFTEAFPLFGLDLADYDELFDEKLDLLLRLRESTEVTWSGRHRPPLVGQRVYPRPVQDPLPVWVGVGGTPQSFIRAGLLGLPLMVAIIGGEPRQFAPLIALYRRAGAEAGHAPETLRVGLHCFGFLGDDVEHATSAFYPGWAALFTQVSRERGFPPPTRRQFDATRGPDGAFFVGDPETVAAKCLRVSEQLGGVERINLQMTNPRLRHADLLHSIELLGTGVVPLVKS